MLWLHTVISTRALCVDDRIGSLQPGRFADFVVVDPHRPDVGPLWHPVRSSVLACGLRDLQQVHIGGELVSESGVSTNPPTAEASDRLHEMLPAIACEHGRPAGLGRARGPRELRYRAPVTPERFDELTALRRARDLMDRRFAEPLDVSAIAAAVFLSEAHFSRRFHAAYGETPYGYLISRRIERACTLLRAGLSVTEVCMRVGWTSLGSFSSSFTAAVGLPPSAYRSTSPASSSPLPDCTVRIAGRRPRSSRIGEGRTGVDR